MEEYIGLDVSMKETAISIRRNGKRVWRGKCASDPKVIATLLRKHSPAPKRVIFETGPLSVWFYHGLTAEGLPAICIDARHAKAALDMAANKTDANDADGLAQLAEVFGPHIGRQQTDDRHHHQQLQQREAANCALRARRSAQRLSVVSGLHRCSLVERCRIRGGASAA